MPFVVHFGYGCLADVAVYKEVFEKIEEEEDEEEDDDEGEIPADDKVQVIELSHAQPWMDGHSAFWTSLSVTSSHVI